MDFRLASAREDEEPEINLIALIDVLLMTLIFLLVTTSFSREARLSIKLPSAAQQAAQQTQAPLEQSPPAHGTGQDSRHLPD